MTQEPKQEYFAIGDVCELTGLKPHVLRYWESQFRFLHPAKNRSGNRVYQRKDVELIQLVKHLLYVDKYTIDGARQQIEQRRKDGTLRRAARTALDAAVARDLEHELHAVLDLLAGRPAAPPHTVGDDIPAS
ncbi:MAG: MerR family transcriptional regulator [Gemmatimonadaceae bacterium]|nr:MerR family transcriptional regulator [Gemmatimonadaceae bacterium]